MNLVKLFVTLFVTISVSTFASTKYSRAEFGPWLDKDRNCLNTREEIIKRDSIIPVIFERCNITSGKWVDPYTLTVVTNPSRLDIDHVIPLKWAFEHGADKWSKTKKSQFANDPIHLLAVSASANRSKGDKGFDQWLPTHIEYQCAYISIWERTLTKYSDLQLSLSEQMAFNVMLRRCKLK